MNYKIIYQLREFGISPTKVFSRLLTPPVGPVFANSLPKAGTNLLSRALSFVPPAYRVPVRTLSVPRFSSDRIERIIRGLKRNQIVTAHVGFQESLAVALRESGVRHILIFRDPRDVLVSAAYYIGEMDRDHAGYSLLSKMTLPERIDFLLARHDIRDPKIDDLSRSHSHALNFPDEVSSFVKWLPCDDVLLVKYENLVGPGGGGKMDLQVEELSRMAAFLAWDVKLERLEAIAARLYYTKAKTFRKGALGAWREVLSVEQVGAVKAAFGNDIVRLGYERNCDW